MCLNSIIARYEIMMKLINRLFLFLNIYSIARLVPFVTLRERRFRMSHGMLQVQYMSNRKCDTVTHVVTLLDTTLPY